jgi:hypothetical protein
MSAARAYLDAVGGDALTSATTEARRDAIEATVIVEGTALSVIPGWEPRVRQTATVPVERLTVISPQFVNPEGSEP